MNFVRGRRVGVLLSEKLKSIGRSCGFFFLFVGSKTLQKCMGLLRDDDISITIFETQHHQEDKGLQFSSVGFIHLGDLIHEVLVLHDDFLILLDEHCD